MTSKQATQSVGLDVLSIKDAKDALKYAIAADAPICLVGPPGIGKSAIVANVAEELGMKMETLILSLCEPTDLGGFPVVGNGAVNRLPLGPIKAACDEPVVLFLDELSCAPPVVQGAALRLVYERWAGDRKLHPGTVVVAAMNPPDQAAGGWEISLPMIGRLVMIHLRPTLKEVQGFFYELGEPGSDVRNLAVDFAATLEMAPDLLVIDPPQGSVVSGRPWGAPRSWHRGLSVMSQVKSDSPSLCAALLSGCVGEDSASSFLAIRKIRTELPSVTDIMSDPTRAKVPSDLNSCVAVLGIVAQVATVDPCPAWVYASRLKDEVGVAAMNILGRFALKNHNKSKWFADANKAVTGMLKTFGANLRPT